MSKPQPLLSLWNMLSVLLKMVTVWWHFHKATWITTNDGPTICIIKYWANSTWWLIPYCCIYDEMQSTLVIASCFQCHTGYKHLRAHLISQFNRCYYIPTPQSTVHWGVKWALKCLHPVWCCKWGHYNQGGLYFTVAMYKHSAPTGVLEVQNSIPTERNTPRALECW